MSADRPSVGVLKTDEGHVKWIRAWSLHEGITIPQDARELRITTLSQAPRSAVYPIRRPTCRRRIWHAGSEGYLPFQGGGDAPSVTHVKLVLASSTKLRRGDPGVRNGTDTYLVIALHDLTKDGFEVYPTATPSRWLRPMRSTRRDSGRLHTCRLRCQYIAVARASNHEAAQYRVRILQGT